MEDPSELIIDVVIYLGELIPHNLALEIELCSRTRSATIDLLTEKMLKKINNDLTAKHPFAALQKLNIKPKD